MQPWVIANPYGILVDAQNYAWHAGRVYDMLSLGTGRILVASETGGVWYIDGAFNGVPLSNDWDWPDVHCLAFGPAGTNHIFAGCSGGLYETDPNAPDPLHAWHPVNLPPKVSIVYRVATTVEPPRVVLATDRGIWWAGGNAGTIYAWKQATGLAIDAPFFGLARCDRGVIAGVRNSVAKFVGGLIAGGTVSGIYVGQWDSADLVMKPAVINGLTTTQISTMRSISVATCRDHLERAYAVSADADGKVFAILRSATGGQDWDQCSMNLEGNHDAKWDVQNFSGEREQGGWHKTISVHPIDADVVGFGWRHAMVSKNRGDSWRLLGGEWTDPNTWDYSTSHMHDDVHAVYFEPEFTNRRLYVLSDGGVAQTQNWDGESTDFKSAMNKNLANLQFYSTLVSRGFWGTLGISNFAPVIGGGLQDNGNVWCGLVSGFLGMAEGTRRRWRLGRIYRARRRAAGRQQHGKRARWRGPVLMEESNVQLGPAHTAADSVWQYGRRRPQRPRSRGHPRSKISQPRGRAYACGLCTIAGSCGRHHEPHPAGARWQGHGEPHYLRVVRWRSNVFPLLARYRATAALYVCNFRPGCRQWEHDIRRHRRRPDLRAQRWKRTPSGIGGRDA